MSDSNATDPDEPIPIIETQQELAQIIDALEVSAEIYRVVGFTDQGASNDLLANRIRERLAAGQDDPDAAETETGAGPAGGPGVPQEGHDGGDVDR